MARDRRAALGDSDRRRRDRRGDDGHAAGRRDAVRGLRLLRLGPPRDGRREAALARGTPVPITLRLPSGGGFSGGPFHSQNPESLVRAHPGPQVRVPVDARGREGPDQRRDRGSEPRPLLRAQAPVPPDQGRGARRALHDPDRQGAHPPGGRRHHRRHLGRDGAHGRPRRRPSSTTCRSRSSTCGRCCRGTRKRCSSRCARRRRCSSCTRTRTPAASAPRSRRRSPRRPSSISTRRRGASPRPTRPSRSRRCSRRRSSRRSPTSWPALRELAEY